MSEPVIGYAGMTHLGINSLAAAAERGFPVVGFDPDPGRIALLAGGGLPVVEPDLPETMERNRARIRFTAAAADLAACDVVYIAVDVATDDRGGSDLGPLRALLAVVEPALRPDATLVILSQVPPGFTRALPVTPGRHLAYQVETLIFGRAVERALHPERFIVGRADPAAPLPAALARFLDGFGCPVLVIRFESAELAKIAINCCLVASIGVANTLAELCERIGADWSEIVPTLRLDKRIGEHAYIVPGLGIAGGNLERDLATVCRLADETGSDARIVRAWIANNRQRRDWAFRRLQSEVLSRRRAPTVAVWGLAYKQDTNSTKNSPALALLSLLGDVAVAVHDPVVDGSTVGHPRLTVAGDPLEACRDADALVIMTPWAEYRRADPAAIAAALAGRVVIDPFAVLDKAACAAAGLAHHVLGRAP